VEMPFRHEPIKHLVFWPPKNNLDLGIPLLYFPTTPLLVKPLPLPLILGPIANMGLLEAITGSLGEQISHRGVGIVAAAGFAAFLVLAVVLNVLNQLLFKNPNEPPIVFHWFPILGNTIFYGMDPYTFFFDCRAKVS
jgi:hypothetical protein